MYFDRWKPAVDTPSVSELVSGFRVTGKSILDIGSRKSHRWGWIMNVKYSPSTIGGLVAGSATRKTIPQNSHTQIRIEHPIVEHRIKRI